MTHAFVVEFENAEDRDYYMTEDPVHADLAKLTAEHLGGATQVDFTPGVY